MWNIKTKMIPITKGATGTISKAFRKIPEQHTWKAQNQGTAKYSHFGQCTHTTERINVKVQNA
jgi:hypothetical protein